LQQYVLGVEPTTPGFRSWRIEPHGGTLAWAQGRVPTPEGPLSAWWRWTGSAGARRGYTMAASVPSGTTGEVALPVPEHGIVTVDGRRVWKNGTQSADARWDAGDRRIVVHGLGAGDHVITWVS
jgi:alpha-L-rhamnosidase